MKPSNIGMIGAQMQHNGSQWDDHMCVKIMHFCCVRHPFLGLNLRFYFKTTLTVTLNIFQSSRHLFTILCSTVLLQ